MTALAAFLIGAVMGMYAAGLLVATAVLVAVSSVVLRDDEENAA